MEKKSKEMLRRYKKARPASSTDSSSSSDSDSSSSDSYSSSSSKKKSSHRKKKGHATRRSSSSSDDDKVRKREKQHACQKKLEAKRNHLKRKLKEAKERKKRAISPSLRRRSVTPPHKSKKLSDFVEKKHHQLGLKERLLREKEREREKLRMRDRERGRSRSPKSNKIRIHQEVSSKSPQSRHQIPVREKIIIQARRDHSPSDRKRELKVHQDSRERERRRERAEREAARNKEREEALARCQERQRERERLAREKLRREKEKDYERSAVDRLLPRPAEREMAIAAARGYESRERSLEVDPRAIMHSRSTRALREAGYEREREFLAGMELRGEREERREHERDFVVVRRRDVSPSEARYIEKLRERELYTEEERYKRPYELPEEELRGRERNWEHEIRREHEHSKLYPVERSSVGIVPPGRDWKPGGPEDWEHWQEKGWPRPKKMAPTPEAEWEPNEKYSPAGAVKWDEPLRNKHEHARPEATLLQPSHGPGSRRWPQEWRGNHAPPSETVPHTTAPQRHPIPQVNFRINQLTANQPIDFNPERANFRLRLPHPLPLLQHGPTGPVNFHPRPLFPPKRQMTYTNPNLIKNKVGIPTPVLNNTSHIPPLLPGLTANPPIKVPSAGAPPTVDKEAALHISPVIKNQLAIPKEVNAIPVLKKPDEKPTTPVVEEPAAIPQFENQEISTISEVKNTDETNDKLETEKEDSIPDDLSEISDGDDDILDKVEDKSQSINTNDLESTPEAIDTDSQSIVENHNSTPSPIETNEINKEDDLIVAAIVNDEVTKSEVNDDDILDFEEISDGELEEESKIKGVGDALGVDWESLVAETKVRYNLVEPTTAKQKWQPHRIIMDIGISTKMAGEEFARQILQQAKEKLEEENCKPKIKQEIKDECDEEDNNQENVCKSDLQFELLHSLACVQVGQRQQREDRMNLIFNAYGDNSRALSARHDLRLRRKLCGLPIKDIDYAQPVSDRLKSLALKMFQKAIETK